MLNRKNQVQKRAATEVEEAKQLAAAQEDEIRQAVIKLYQDVLLRQKLLKIKSVALGNARVNAEMVEKNSRNGWYPLRNMFASDIVSRAEGEYRWKKICNSQTAFRKYNRCAAYRQNSCKVIWRL